uniref:protein kinase family protein n=1 Tax=Candidatus Ruminimicrobium bovinum TaxID=3242779 RepID=UPI0039B96936
MSLKFDENREKKFNQENRALILEPVFQKGISIHDIYEVYDENKTGGMGFIGLCRNKIDKNFYVLKTYQCDNNSNSFKEEIKFTLKLEKHPHIVYSQTALKEKDRVYLVMELVGKQPKNKKAEWKAATLTQELQKGIKIKESYKWAIEFCRGMQYLNSIGMKAHQDIKPDNILITAKRHIKISDFGFVTLKEEEGKTKGWSDYYYS